MKTSLSKIISISLISAVMFTACNQHDAVKEANEANKENKDTVATTTAAAVNTDDAEFATKAASVGMMEVQLGNLAGQKSQNAKVKAFGAMMVTDHTKAGDELKTIAASKNITLPATLSNDQQGMVDEMNKMSGAEFDKHYMGMMVHGHENTIDAFKKEGGSGKDAELVAFASKTLPTLQGHLDKAKEIEASLKGK